MSSFFSNMKAVGDKVGEKVFRFDSSILTLVAIVSVIFAILIMYIIYNIYNNKLQGIQLTKTPIKLSDLTSPVMVDNSKIPVTSVGREYTYAFWIYLEDFKPTYKSNPNKTIVPMDQLIIFRSADGNYASANPIVFMDGLTNKMYIAIKTEDSTLTDTANVKYNENPYYIRNMNYYLNNNLLLNGTDPDKAAINKHLILNIDYVPLQRWVHISVVVDNKIITVFLDGEIYSVRSTEEFSSSREAEKDVRGNTLQLNKIVDNTSGNLYIGGKVPQSSSYLSKINFFNYAVDIYTIKKLYSQSPTGSMFNGTYINYGVRNPFYKLDTIQADNTTSQTI